MGVQERLSFEDATAPTLIAGEHRHRYELAAPLLRGRRVLDLCCGTGYGSRILAASARSVHGVDIDAGAVDAAAAALAGTADVDFEAADAVAFLRRADLAERFDAIVCFEGLEHLRDLEPALERLRELAEGGMPMLLSVPNSEGLGEDNEFHATDFGWESALERLGGFPGATVLTQYLAEGSVICVADPSDRGEPAPRIRLGDRREPEYANHYIVCVGIEAEPLDALMEIEASPLANRYMRDLERANDDLRRANARLTREHLGKADAAAAAELARRADRQALEEKFLALEESHSAWVERCLGAEARERDLEHRLVAVLERNAEFEALPVIAARSAWRRIRRRRRRV